MDLTEIFKQLDNLLQENRTDEAEAFLKKELEQALSEGHYDIAISLLNEMMGFFRETGQKEKSYECIDALEELMERLDLKSGIHYGTTLLNEANAYRAGGDFEKSRDAYRKAESIYRANFGPDDGRFAPFYNNLSLLCQETGDFKGAVEALLKALEIIDKQPDSELEQAVTRTNLASALISLKEYSKAGAYISEALKIFKDNNIKDVHYCGALSALGLLKYNMGEYGEAASAFLSAANGIKEALGSDNQQYQRVMENYGMAFKALENSKGNNKDNGIKGMELSKRYYEAYGKPMLKEKFPEYEDRITVGLVGEGSECFGLDDEISRDHDWGPGFCMWLNEDDYKVIGERLNKEYLALPGEFMDFSRLSTKEGRHRQGAMTVRSFYTRLLGDDVLPRELFKTELKESGSEMEDELCGKICWLKASEDRLAAAVNGCIFKEGDGSFTGIRRLIKRYYPENVHYRLLAQHTALFSQSGQYNFDRMLKRGNKTAAAMEAVKAVKETLFIINLINKKYCCHDKWLFTATDFEGAFSVVPGLLDKICENVLDPLNSELFEEIARVLAKELYKKHFISDEDSFLKSHTDELISKSLYYELSREELEESIIRSEFEAFDKVKNMGGRVDCQDDFNTFHIMRKSQYMTWTKAMLVQYLYEFNYNYSRGRNMVEEKYARMMEYTAPSEYEAIKDRMPYISSDKKRLIDIIAGLQTEMMSEFAEKYPVLAKNARNITSLEDDLYNTSSQTYLKGELSTYSDKLLELYGRYAAGMKGEGRNIAEETIKNTVLLYGYKSLLDAESRLKNDKDT